MAKIVSLDLHDFSIIHNRLELLLELKNYFHDFRVSLFTVPIDEKQDFGPYLIRDELLKKVKKELDWIQLIPHGLEHKNRYDACPEHGVGYFDEIEDTFRKDGLPFVKGFLAPHWKWNLAVINEINSRGWWGAIHPDKNMVTPKRFYKFTHSLDQSFLEAEGNLKLHGHVYGTKDDLGLHMDKLLKLPKDTEWHFITDFIETK